MKNHDDPGGNAEEPSLVDDIAARLLLGNIGVLVAEFGAARVQKVIDHLSENPEVVSIIDTQRERVSNAVDEVIEPAICEMLHRRENMD